MLAHHCMLTQDRDAVIKRARKAGVSAMVITGSSLSSSRRAQDICSTSLDSLLYFTAGVHPHDAKSCDEKTLPALRDLASHPTLLRHRRVWPRLQQV